MQIFVIGAHCSQNFAVPFIENTSTNPDRIRMRIQFVLYTEKLKSAKYNFPRVDTFLITIERTLGAV